jgi:hypothetical protein
LETKTFFQIAENWNVAAIAKHLLGRHAGFGAVNDPYDFTREIRNRAVCRLGLQRTEPAFRQGEYSTIHKTIISIQDRQQEQALLLERYASSEIPAKDDSTKANRDG